MTLMTETLQVRGIKEAATLFHIQTGCEAMINFVCGSAALLAETIITGQHVQTSTLPAQVLEESTNWVFTPDRVEFPLAFMFLRAVLGCVAGAKPGMSQVRATGTITGMERSAGHLG
jgi:hypothetical protein